MEGSGMTKWQWWAGSHEEWMTVGPCDTKEQVIQEATQDGIGEWKDDNEKWFQSFHIVEARQDPLKLSEWIGLDYILERADESLADSDRVSCENDDGPWFECTKDQEADLISRIRAACDNWQADHALVFTCPTFSHSRNHEDVTVACKETTE
jgi:hypothetical protein